MTSAAVQRAFDRASAEHLSAMVQFVKKTGGGVSEYTVPSASSGGRYTVRVSADGTLYSCTCKGGQREACKHRAALAQYRASRADRLGQPDGPRHAIRGDRGYEAAHAAFIRAYA